MKIYSWNMFFDNPDLDRAFDFVRQSDFDIFCIQEAPVEFIDKLRTLPYCLDAADEMDQLRAGKPSKRNLAILSRYPLVVAEHIPLPYREPTLKPRAKLFLRLAVSLRIWGLGRGNRHTQRVVIDTPRGLLELFNLHLPLATPAWRKEEFGLVLNRRDPRVPTVICGDFNILEHPRATPLTWFLGGTVSDVVFYKRERIQMEKLFSKHSLANPLRDAITQKISRSQLDHILVSQDFEIKSAAVIADSYGSDHQPIFAEVA
jgi:endonuclease/exonuclease/phosphatase family metal-dependent hydrolase